MMNSINNINSKVTKIFNNPNINFFIIMMLIFIISCYTFINTPLKYAISSFVSNPIIILFTLICVILTSYYNINIAILILLLLFITIYGSTMFYTNGNSNSNSNSKSKNSIESFTADENDDDSESESDDEEDSNDNTNSLLNKKINERKQKEDESLKLDEKIASIKDTILGTVNKINDSGNNDYKQSLLENKQIQFMNEQKKNKNNKNKLKSNRNSNSNNRSSTKEKFQTVDKRTFNPNDEEDTNLLITKEVLIDMNNRIEYNFESKKYLKKYLKHRIEEVVELNKLLDDE